MSARIRTLVFQLTAGILVFVLVVREVQWRSVVTVLASANVPGVLIGLGVFIAAWLLGAWKWESLARAINAAVPRYATFLMQYLIGQFYAMFVPGGLAVGEAVKMWRMRLHGSPVRMAWSVVADRLTGFIALAVLGSLAYATVAKIRHAPLAGLFAVVVLAAGLVSILVLAFPGFTDLFMRGVYGITPVRWRQRLAALDDAIRTFHGARGPVIRGILLGCLIHVTWAVAVWFAAGALALPVPLTFAFWLYLCLGMALFIPISYAGLGVREGVLVLVLRGIGVAPSGALALAALVFFYQSVVSIAGGVLEVRAWGR